MAYSCSDFTDSIIEALGITIPDESNDSPEDQAALAVAEIERLQRAEHEARSALAALKPMLLADVGANGGLHRESRDRCFALVAATYKTIADGE